LNEKFFELTEEKQKTIINSAMSVFAENEYKKATTDDITKRANISKGLLFHYFDNKKGLYLYVYKFAENFLIEKMSKSFNYEETDFFEMLISANSAKLKILLEYPDIFNFIIKAYFEKNEEVKTNLNIHFKNIIKSSSSKILERADLYKFKDGVSAEKVLNLIIWASDGFMRSKFNQLIDYDKLSSEYISYLLMLKQNFYKEKYL